MSKAKERKAAAKCAVWGLVKEWKELRGDVKKLFDLLQSVRKELAVVRKMLNEGSFANER